MSPRNITRIVTFVFLAFALSWTEYFILGPLLPEEVQIVVFVLFMFGPLFAALICGFIFDRGKIIAMLALRPRKSWWWLVAWMLPCVLGAAAMLVTMLMTGNASVSIAEGLPQFLLRFGMELPNNGSSLELPPFWLALIISILLGGPINMLTAIGEEVGWRGYLWTLMRPIGFWRTSAVIGIIWGLWHLPLIAIGHNYGTEYPFFPYTGIVMMVVFTLGMSPLHGLIRDRSKSVWPATLFHGTINAVSSLFLIVQPTALPLINGLPGIAGAIVFAVSSTVILLMGLDGNSDQVTT